MEYHVHTWIQNDSESVNKSNQPLVNQMKT